MVCEYVANVVEVVVRQAIMHILLAEEDRLYFFRFHFKNVWYFVKRQSCFLLISFVKTKMPLSLLE